MESDEDSDEIYDEIDRYHMSSDDDDDDDDNVIRKRRRVEEVLNVEGDSSFDEDSDDDDDGDGGKKAFSDSDDDNDDSRNVDKLLPSADKWGSGRKSFYNTSYVDEDWGGMNDDEVELAGLEEEDAVARQKKLDAALGHVQFQDDILEEEEEAIQDRAEIPDISCMTSEERYQYFLKVNPDLKQIYDEYQAKRSYFVSKVLPLLDMARTISQIRQGLVLEKQLLLAVNVFARYLTNLLFAIHIKIASSSSEEVPRFIDHPVLQAISTSQKQVEVVMRFLDKQKNVLGEMRRKIKSKSFRNVLDKLPTVEDIQKSKRLPEKSKKNEQLHVEENEEWDAKAQNAEDNVEKEITKRLITSQIEKNKGLQNKRKRGTQHSRVKKRKQFKKALIKKRSQKPEIRKELTPYGGETRGIRISTVKSVKLKA